MLVDQWLTQCTDGRLHKDTIAILHSYSNWLFGGDESENSPPEGREDLPAWIVEQVLGMGRVEWGATAELMASGHIENLEKTLRLTREKFNLEDVPVRMHGLYLEGTETVLCHTGTSPNSGPNAQALTGAWNWLHDECLAVAVRKGMRDGG